MRIKNIAPLFFILLIGAIVRFYQPPGQIVPPSLNWDEASLGYNAYSILKTGKDEWGKALPLSFEAFGDYKLPGYIYTTVPFVGLLGLNEQSVRLPSQLAGIISILLLYLIAEKLANRKLAVVSAFLLAISPWHLFLSRIAVEANLSFAFFLAGFYFFLKGLSKSKWLSSSALLFGITLFTYNSARVFVPLFLFALTIIYRRELRQFKSKLILPLGILAIFTFAAFYHAVLIDSNARYFWVAIIDQGAVNCLNQARNISSLPGIIVPLVYNRYTYLVVNVLVNYLKHFSPAFLFVSGCSNYQFSLPGHGLLYIIEVPFLLAGLFFLRKEKWGKILLFWLLLAPIPASITRESPHALRSIYMLG